MQKQQNTACGVAGAKIHLQCPPPSCIINDGYVFRTVHRQFADHFPGDWLITGIDQNCLVEIIDFTEISNQPVRGLTLIIEGYNNRYQRRICEWIIRLLESAGSQLETQCIELDESSGIRLIIGSGIFFKGDDFLVKQGIGPRPPGQDVDISLV